MNALLMTALAGYLLGAIPFGFLIGKARGTDIRKHGSGNIGATNVSRTLGRQWGAFVFVLDAAKGALAVAMAERFFAVAGFRLGAWPVSTAQFGIAGAVACILGHNFPIWLGFKGGKGIATSAGALVALMPPVAAVAATFWLALFYSSRIVSLGSIGAALSLPAAAWFFEGGGGSLFWFAAIIAALALWRHKPNIQRLLAGTENRFEKKKA